MGNAVNGNVGSSESGPESSTARQWSTRRVVTATLVVLLVVLAFWLLYRFQLVVFGLFEAIVFSTALRPLVDWLERRKISRPVGGALGFLLVLGLLVGMILLIVPLFTEQGSAIVGTLTQYYQDLRQALVTSGSLLVQRLALRLPVNIRPLSPLPTDPQQTLDQAAIAIQYGREILRGLFFALTILLLTFYWTIDRSRIMLSVSLLIPADRREAARSFYEAIEEKVGAYLGGLGIMCAAIGLLSLAAYLIIGLPYALLLAILAGLMEAVPLIGPILGAVPAVLVALALDPEKVSWVVLSTVIIQALENNLLVPRVMDRSVGVNPVVSLLAFVIFSSLFGLAGALLAIPLAATIQLIVNRTLMAPTPTAQAVPTGRDSLSLLRYEAQELIQDVRKQSRDKETSAITDPTGQVEDAIEAIVNDLDSILSKEENNDAPQGAEASA